MLRLLWATQSGIPLSAKEIQPQSALLLSYLGDSMPSACVCALPASEGQCAGKIVRAAGLQQAPEAGCSAHRP